MASSRVESPVTTTVSESPAEEAWTMMEEIASYANLRRALAQVCSNNGSPGIDGMTMKELRSYFQAHWPELQAQLLGGEVSSRSCKED